MNLAEVLGTIVGWILGAPFAALLTVGFIHGLARLTAAATMSSSGMRRYERRRAR